ncbi:stage II sporulation protein M [Erythrobacter dokdonensis]|uniref:Putative membrane protein n=1 Tax=Erythrobacter dokdonensis DSW-74 TaxID=1300349 RepID=A0A1A7BCZ2_9SPHN|nr:stage II sporulation protein M [Erythrobacter dokdonensis]OBV10359.1 putative membrane protein [Erythrobacter dokdonensis DSW-74]
MKTPILSSWFGRGAVAAPPDIESATLRSDRFRLEREGDWRRLEDIVARMERGGLKRIPDEELLALPALYRTAASSLAVARETSLDAATIAYLESLVQRAWFQVYGPPRGFAAWLRDFIGGGWSRAVRGMWLDICVALFVMVAGSVVGWLLVARDEAWYYRLVPGTMADARVPGASREDLLATLATEESAAGLSTFAAYLFSNNSAVCILAFALGFAFGIPSLLLLVHNMALLGAMVWLFSGQGLTVELAAWLSVHGTTELFGILLSGAAGLHIGRSMAFPGTRPVLTAASEAGRRGAVVMVGVVIMMVIAALLEAFPRQLVDGTGPRFLIGGTMLAFWLAYFFLYRPRAARNEALE